MVSVVGWGILGKEFAQLRRGRGCSRKTDWPSVLGEKGREVEADKTKA